MKARVAIPSKLLCLPRVYAPKRGYGMAFLKFLFISVGHLGNVVAIQGRSVLKISACAALLVGLALLPDQRAAALDSGIPDAQGTIVGVTCADGTTHEPGFNCQAYLCSTGWAQSNGYGALCRSSTPPSRSIPSAGASTQQMIQQQTMRNWQMLFQKLLSNNQQEQEQEEEQERIQKQHEEEVAQQQALEKQQEEEAEHKKLCGELKGDVCNSNQGLQLKGVDDSNSGDLQLKTGTDFFGTNPSPQATITNCKLSAAVPTGSAIAELQNTASQSQAAVQAATPECAKAETTDAFTSQGRGSTSLQPFHGGAMGAPGLSDAQAKQAKALLAQVQQISDAMSKDQQTFQQTQQQKQTADQALQQAQQSITQLQAQEPAPVAGAAPTPDPNLTAAQQLLSQAQQKDQQATTGLQQAQQKLDQDQTQFSKLQDQQKQFMSNLNGDSDNAAGSSPPK